ncbi:major paralogous domain-containing protein, partial [Chryseobacterium sp. RU37D]|uniref:FISUMP domain-containing protein n=1 Tax=Chryseobacterium sp. RU37D TaxID=1907397 RepID=UPI0009542FEB
TNFIGTTDAVDFIAKTNNQERLRISSSGNVGIGMGGYNPAAKLDLQGNQLINASKTYLTSREAIDINIGDDGYTYGNRTENYGILMRTKSSSETGSIARINFGDKGTSMNSGSRYLSFSVGKKLNELLYLTDENNGNVGIGTTTPNAQSSLDLSAPDKALLTNRVANTSVITSPAEGMIVYVKDEKCFKGYANSLWRDITPCSGGTPIVTQLNCGGGALNGSFTSGVFGNGSFSLPYAGGNGVAYSGQTIFSTGVTGLTATLSAGTLANGSGSLAYTISGTPSSSGTASFTVNFGGQLCTFNVNVSSSQPQVILLNCGGGALNGSFTSGVFGNGSFSLPYAGGNGVAYSGQTIFSTGVTGLTATLSAGTLANGSGSLAYTISGTPSSSGTANFTVNFGGQSCTFNVNVSSSQPQVILLNCGGGALNGSFTSGTSSNGTFNLPYAGGNGVAYIGQTILSTGVTGLTATLNAGTLANGSGSLTYTISGTPSSSGTANFTVNFGGQSCTFNVNVGAAKCGAYIAPGQWKDFMCHNLGADVSADPFTPSASIQGAKYQWGATTGQTGRYYSQANDQANAGSITGWNAGSIFGLPDNTWQDGVKTVNDPCPAGYRVPTSAQWQSVMNNNAATRVGTWINSATNYSTAIKFGASLLLPAAGNRELDFGTLVDHGNFGYYWSSTQQSSISNANGLTFNNNIAGVYLSSRNYGFSVRCISE